MTLIVLLACVHICLGKNKHKKCFLVSAVVNVFGLYSISQNFGHTLSFNVFLHFYHSLHCRLILNTSKLWKNTWNYVVNKKCYKNQNVLYFRFFKVATFLLWWQLCTLLAFSQSASWGSHLEWFTSSLEGVPRGAEHLFAALPSLCGPTQHKPSKLGLCQVIVDTRSSDAALHHSTSWSNSPYAAWRCVWCHYLVEKQMMVPLSPNQMGWHVTAECYGSHAG